MAYYYFKNLDTQQVVRESRTPFNVDDSIQPPPPIVQLKRVDDDTQPAFNAATHKLVREFVDDDVAHTRTFRWVVTALSQAEIDARTEEQQAEVTRQQIRAEYLNLKNGVGTTAERAARLEKAVAWLLRQAVKN